MKVCMNIRLFCPGRGLLYVSLVTANPSQHKLHFKKSQTERGCIEIMRGHNERSPVQLIERKAILMAKTHLNWTVGVTL